MTLTGEPTLDNPLAALAAFAQIAADWNCPLVSGEELGVQGGANGSPSQQARECVAQMAEILEDAKTRAERVTRKVRVYQRLTTAELAALEEKRANAKAVAEARAKLAREYDMNAKARAFTDALARGEAIIRLKPGYRVTAALNLAEALDKNT